MSEKKKAVIFCSASNKIDVKYNELARKVVRDLCGLGYDIVSGGTIKGTMGVVCEEAAACNAGVIAVVPSFMAGLENPIHTEIIWTDTMSERKEKMREGTSVAIALPGGVGTMDELMETYCLARLHRYDGKVIAVNYEGFYNPLKALIDHLIETGMLEPEARGIVSFPETPEEVVALLK